MRPCKRWTFMEWSSVDEDSRQGILNRRLLPSSIGRAGRNRRCNALFELVQSDKSGRDRKQHRGRFLTVCLKDWSQSLLRLGQARWLWRTGYPCRPEGERE